MTEQLTQFDYLLNAMMHAGRADKPAEHGYKAKRDALYAYVRDLERRASASHEAAGLPVQQEPKYTVNGHAIVNRASGEAIPADEPVFIFRARDKFAAAALADYENKVDLLSEDDEHLDAVRARVAQFRKWAAANPGRMKEPDTAAPTPQPEQAQHAEPAPREAAEAAKELDYFASYTMTPGTTMQKAAARAVAALQALAASPAPASVADVDARQVVEIVMSG